MHGLELIHTTLIYHHLQYQPLRRINYVRRLSVLMVRNIVGILPVSNDFTAYTSTVCPTYWDCKSSDNDSSLIRELNGVTSIRLTVYESVLGTVFNAANNAGINTTTKYVCILTFT